MHIWGHFKTITKHKLMVMKYCFKIGLYRQGMLHDLSKYSWTEFSAGCKYYQGNRSPKNAEREATGLSTAWIHHYGRNKHHFEHWVDYGIDCDTIIKGVPMPRNYIAEMVMDRICASKVYHPESYTNRAPLEYCGLCMRIQTVIWNFYYECWQKKVKKKHYVTFVIHILKEKK